MANLIARLVSTISLRQKLLKKHRKQGGMIYVRFEKEFDAFLLMIVPPRIETVVHYVDENIGLLYEANKREVVGIQIEGFVKSFLPKHKELFRDWKLENKGAPKDLGDTIVAMNEIKPKVVNAVFEASKPSIFKENKDLTRSLQESLLIGNIAAI